MIERKELLKLLWAGNPSVSSLGAFDFKLLVKIIGLYNHLAEGVR